MRDPVDSLTMMENKYNLDFDIILRKNDGMIVSYVTAHLDQGALSRINRLSFDKSDVIQEVRIDIWRLLATRYNPNRCPVVIFIACHLPFSFKKIIHQITESMTFTGKRRTRTNQAKILKSSVSLNRMTRHHDDSYDEQSSLYDEKLMLSALIRTASGSSIANEIDYRDFMQFIGKKLFDKKRDLVQLIANDRRHIADVAKTKELIDYYASMLGVSTDTVRNYLKSIFKTMINYIYD